jgi:SAM-dependent methyltransferase
MGDAAPGTGHAARRWSDALAAWRIPDRILGRAPAPPWSFPAGLARADPDPVDTPSRDRGREALPAGGDVLDVGCGAGRAGLALVPPAARVVGVDRDPGALRAFVRAAAGLGVRHEAVLGPWPDVAGRVALADVAVAHHVAYGVEGLGRFAAALDARARHRVVLELAQRHPLAWLAPLWRRFWGLDRPDGPTAADARDVLAAAGMAVQVEEWADASRRGPQVLTVPERIEYVRTRLCLTADRDPEIADALHGIDLDAPHRVVTLWWDAGRIAGAAVSD